MGDLVFVEVLDIGMILVVGDEVGVVEFVKVVFDIYILVFGEVIEVNECLEVEFELVNFDFYGEGWMFKI